MRALYSLVMMLATPFVLGYLALRGLRDTRYWHGWPERLVLGRVSRPSEIVIHAASVGEVNAAAALVRGLLATPGTGRLLLTTFTPTGAARARALFGDRLAYALAPLDLPGATRRFLQRHRPSAMLIVETEIWPNLLAAARQRQIPAIVVNARLSEQSMRNYTRIGGWMRPAFAGLDRVLAQSTGDAERFERCGTPRSRIEVSGNLKFDAAAPPDSRAIGALLRQEWGDDRPVLVAGSTHEGDETALLEAFGAILTRFPSALLVLAPRHPERFHRVATRISKRGYRLGRHSETGPDDQRTQCLLVDAIGVLQNYYAAADLAFVGGTLAPVGGHNLLEPAALGKPLLFGPHLDNVREIAAQLLEAGAAVQVGNAQDLAEEVKTLLEDASRRTGMGLAGARLVANGQGALKRTLDVIGALLAASRGSR